MLYLTNQTINILHHWTSDVTLLIMIIIHLLRPPSLVAYVTLGVRASRCNFPECDNDRLLHCFPYSSAALLIG